MWTLTAKAGLTCTCKADVSQPEMEPPPRGIPYQLRKCLDLARTESHMKMSAVLQQQISGSVAKRLKGPHQ
jgi:hypothetical protein